MKSAKEKAEELYFKFFSITPEYLNNDECVEFAIQCALILVDEILDAITFNMYDEDSYNQANNFWENVKKEVKAYKK